MSLSPKEEIEVLKRRERKLLRRMHLSEPDQASKMYTQAKRLRKNLREATFLK